MAGREGLAEAYNVLGGIQDAAKQSESELQALAPKLIDEQKNLEQLLEKATAQGDEENITRARMLLDQCQQAWITIQQTVGDEDESGEGEATASPESAPTTAAGPAETETPPSGEPTPAPDDAADTGEPDATEASEPGPTTSDEAPTDTEPGPLGKLRRRLSRGG